MKEYNNPIMSHLLQMRGLKHLKSRPYKHYRPRHVASFTDAWIETLPECRSPFVNADESHLLQMRGLKRPF